MGGVVVILAGVCGDCKVTLVEMKWFEGRKVISVKCPTCEEEVLFDVRKMEDALGKPEPELDTEGMLLAEAPERLQ